MTHLLCLGLGFSAQPIAKELYSRGWEISATSRTPAGVERIAALGYHSYLFDVDKGCDVLNAPEDAPLGSVTHLLISAPPRANNDPVLHFHADALRQTKNIQWVGYLSTIGVYGNHNGAWIDETSELKATSERAQRRLEAEQSWQKICSEKNWRFNIFRLAGIYGPGRNALAQLRAQRARRIVKPGQVFNRIHTADIAQAVLRCIDGYGSETIYNLTDNEPAPPQDVVTYGAQLLQIEPPEEIRYEDAEMSEMARSFYADLKRVRNTRMLEDLGLELIHPTYREGLNDILQKEKEQKM